jgi:acetyl esterase/lipase
VNDRATGIQIISLPFSSRVLAITAWLAISLGPLEAAPAASQANQRGEISTAPFKFPPSELLTREEQDATQTLELSYKNAADCERTGDMLAWQKCAQMRPESPVLKKLKARYRVHIHPAKIAGVEAEVITPVEGIASANRERVLINLHGGGLVYHGDEAESIPIAAVGRIKVVRVNYRLAPQHTFPAASEDVAAVYRALLNDYKPENIGIYGCSAGGLLTAEAVAWIQKEKLPRPGAVGMFCGAASFWHEGDSAAQARAAADDPRQKDTYGRFRVWLFAAEHPYFKGANLNDPLVFPIRSQEVLAQFPPSLLVSGTRDGSLSSVVHTHSRLVALGVEAELHVWEGVGHYFFADPDLSQSREVYDVVVKFFGKHLGKTTSKL